MRCYSRIPLHSQCGFAGLPLNFSAPLRATAQRRSCHSPPRTVPPRRVLFFGSDSFSLSHLVALQRWRLQESPYAERRPSISDLSVTTASPTTPVYKFAREHGLPAVLWRDLLAEGVDALQAWDLGVLASFGHLLPEWLLRRLPVVNVHPSLLPRWRGSAPVVHAVLRGDTATGVSVILLRPHHFDRGPILLQRRIATPPGVTSSQLLARLGELGAEALIEVLEDFDDRLASVTEQSAEGSRVARRLRREDAALDWENMSCDQVDRLSRSVGDLFPLHTVFEGAPVKLFGIVGPTEMKALVTDFPSLWPLLASGGDGGTSVAPGGIVFSKACKEFAFVKCCGAADDWTAFRAILIGRTETTRRKLTALEFFNGVISNSPQANVKFVSLKNPLFSKAKIKR